MTSTSKKLSASFWIISVIALIWNLMGVFFYLAQAYMTEADVAALPEEQRALYENVPAWVTAAFAIAVFAGAIGCIFLLLRKKLATTVFVISFVAILVQMTYNFFMSKAIEVNGPFGMIMPIMVIIIGYFLIYYSKKATNNGWLS